MKVLIVAAACTAIAFGAFLLLELWATRASRTARRRARRRKGMVI